MEVVIYTQENGNTKSFVKSVDESVETVLVGNVLGIKVGEFETRIKHPDLNILKYVQVKLSHQSSIYKKLDVVEYLSRGLSVKEIQNLEVSMYLGANEDHPNLTPLIMLVALRDEPNKPKHLCEPKPPKVSVAQKPRVHKVFKS